MERLRSPHRVNGDGERARVNGIVVVCHGVLERCHILSPTAMCASEKSTMFLSLSLLVAEVVPYEVPNICRLVEVTLCTGPSKNETLTGSSIAIPRKGTRIRERGHALLHHQRSSIQLDE